MIPTTHSGSWLFTSVGAGGTGRGPQEANEGAAHEYVPLRYSASSASSAVNVVLGHPYTPRRVNRCLLGAGIDYDLPPMNAISALIGLSFRFAFISPILAIACSHADLAGGPEGPLARRIDAILARPELATSTFGIEIRRLRDGRILYERGAQRLLPPASTTKLVSCAGALALLGPDHRFETKVIRTGPVEDGVLRGDLVLVASGDPNLSQRISPDGTLRFTDNDHTYAGFLSTATAVSGDPVMVLADLAQKVRAAGIKSIDGAVVVDEGLFGERDDEFVGRLSAACVNDNVVDIVVTPAAAAGSPPAIEVRPSHPAITVENRAGTVAASAAEPALHVELKEGWGRFSLTGTIPAGRPSVLTIGRFAHPALAAANLFARELSVREITARDPPRTASAGPAAYEKSPAVAVHLSPPFSEAIKVILKVSHNLHASMLPPLVGALKGGSGDRFTGYRQIHDELAKGGVPVDGIVLMSGSGGGRADSLSARFLVELLSWYSRRKDFPAFHAALPVGGVDGTLATHFNSPELKERVQAKTGTLVYLGALNSQWIYLSKALAGYMDLASRQPSERGPGKDPVAFAILIANTISPTRQGGVEALFRAQEDILAAVLEVHGSGPVRSDP